MRKILLAAILLSVAVSENILMEDHPKLKMTWICDKQLWNRKMKRILRKDTSKMEESLNYEDGRQFPRISDTQFISESKRVPPMFIRRHELARPSQDNLSFDKSKLDSIKPKVFISIGIQEEKNVGSDLQKDYLKRKNYCKNNQGWQIQQPFYVEEPTWIDIDIDRIDSSHHMGSSDPYILTRGKKIYKIKNPEQVDETIEDYEATLGYPNQNKKLLIRNRMRRSIMTNEKLQNKTANIKDNQIKEKNYYNSLKNINRDINNTAVIKIESKGKKSSKIDKVSEETEKSKNRSYDVLVKKYEKDLKNLTKRSLREFEFTKQNQIFANGIIRNFIEQKQKIQREDIPNDDEIDSSKIAKIDQVGRFNNSKNNFAININKRNKKLVLLKNQELPKTCKKCKTYEIDANSKKDVEKNETYKLDIQDVVKKETYNKQDDLSTPDNLVTLYQNKNLFRNRIESLNNEKDIDRNKSVEKAWELYYAYRKKLENERKARNEEDRFEINKDIITESQLTNEPNSRNSEVKPSNYREKRDVCKTCKIKSRFQQDKWLMDIERKIQETLSLERRNKHSDILGRLDEPYIISRGKKTSQDFEKDDLSLMSKSLERRDKHSDILGRLDEPYIISRGKKTSQDFEKNDLSLMSKSQYLNDEDQAKMTSFPVMENLLRMLLMETSNCNTDNCDINTNRLSDERLSPRDRRGMLDEIFAVYDDPYYVARGKRMN